MSLSIYDKPNYETKFLIVIEISNQCRVDISVSLLFWNDDCTVRCNRIEYNKVIVLNVIENRNMFLFSMYDVIH